METLVYAVVALVIGLVAGYFLKRVLDKSSAKAF